MVDAINGDLIIEREFRLSGIFIADLTDVTFRDTKGQFVRLRETSLAPTKLLDLLGAPNFDDMVVTSCRDKTTNQLVPHRAIGTPNLRAAAKAMDQALNNAKVDRKELRKAFSAITPSTASIPIPYDPKEDPYTPFTSPLDTFCADPTIVNMRKAGRTQE